MPLLLLSLADACVPIIDRAGDRPKTPAPSVFVPVMQVGVVQMAMRQPRVAVDVAVAMPVGAWSKKRTSS
jgi:hypothetical protein